MPPRKLMVLMLGAVAMGVILPILVPKFLRPQSDEKKVLASETKELIPVPIANDKVPNKEEPMFQKPSKLYATGYAMRGKHVIVQLSDGSRLTEQDNDDANKPRLTLVTRNFAEYDGVRLWYRPKPAEPKETTSVHGLLGEPASEAVPATPTVFPSKASESGSGAWVTDEYGVQRLRFPETFSRAMNANTTSPVQNSVRSGPGF